MNIIFLYDADETNTLTVPSNREINIRKELFSAQISQYTKGFQAQVSNYLSGV